jgi:2-iminobutanoate/2-iminopropanoate deaminase
MAREIISTDKAPAAIGPYSQAVKLGNLLFVSGQLAIDQNTGELIEGDVKEHTRVALENAAAILAKAGTSFDRVLKATIFLADMGDFAAVNEVYGKYFPVDPPSRSCVQVGALPKGAPVEIELIAEV